MNVFGLLGVQIFKCSRIILDYLADREGVSYTVLDLSSLLALATFCRMFYNEFLC